MLGDLTEIADVEPAFGVGLPCGLESWASDVNREQAEKFLQVLSEAGQTRLTNVC